MLRSRVKSKKSIPTPLLAGQRGKGAKWQSGKVMESKKVSNAHLKQVNSICKQGPAAWQTANQSDLMLRIDADRIVIIALHISIKLCAA